MKNCQRADAGAMDYHKKLTKGDFSDEPHVSVNSHMRELMITEFLHFGRLTAALNNMIISEYRLRHRGIDGCIVQRTFVPANGAEEMARAVSTPSR